MYEQFIHQTQKYIFIHDDVIIARCFIEQCIQYNV